MVVIPACQMGGFIVLYASSMSLTVVQTKQADKMSTRPLGKM